MLALGAGVAAWLAVAPACGHPTADERAEAAEARRLCTRPIAAADDLDPARLGMSTAELRELFPDAGWQAARPDEEGRTRELERPGTGDLARVHYQVWRDRVVRIRWRLAARFERPVLDALVDRARICFGRPKLDQTFAAEPGSTAATYRRIVWEHDERRIELRQLHPLRGGALHLAVASRPALRAMREAGVAPHPLPDRTGSWWERGAAPVVPATPEEAGALSRDFLELLAHADH